MSRRNKTPATLKPESRASKLLKLVEKGPDPSDQGSKGFVLQFQAALIPAAGAVYLLGYLARVNPDYFSLLTVGDFVTSAIMFFPFSIMLMLLPVLGRAFSERVHIHMTILYPLWLKRDGEWSGAFKFMLRTVAVISVLTLSLPFFVSLRMGEQFDPVAGFLTAIWTCFILNEVRCYAMVRYKQQVIWGGQLIVALYLMTTSFFIGHLYAQLHASLDRFTAVIRLSDTDWRCVSTFHKLGDQILFLEPGHELWSVVPNSSIKAIEDLPTNLDAKKIECDAVAKLMSESRASAGAVDPSKSNE